MPFYDFLCRSCGLKTEKFLKKSKESIDCPSCKEKAFLYLENVQFCYQSDQVKGIAEPQNTGFTSFDVDADKVIGAQAKEGWEVINERQAYKKSIMRDYGVPSRFLSKNPDGTYRVMKEEEVKISVNVESLMNEVVTKAKDIKNDK